MCFPARSGRLLGAADLPNPDEKGVSAGTVTWFGIKGLFMFQLHVSLIICFNFINELLLKCP